MNLPDIETTSALVHDAWMESKKKQGVTTRKAEDGEELMVPYSQLTEKAKDLDRGTVKSVYAAIESTPSGSDIMEKELINFIEWTHGDKCPFIFNELDVIWYQYADMFEMTTVDLFKYYKKINQEI